MNPTKPLEQPAGAGVGVATVVNGIIYLLVSFGWVHWDPQQIVVIGAIANVFAQACVGWYIKRTTTPLANPKTAQGIPLVPEVKPLTRGF